MKELIKIVKNFHPNKELLVLFLIVPIIVASLIPYKVLDNDRFFLISLGRSIITKGFPTVDPLSMHYIDNFIAQQWLVDVIFYLIYKYVGDIGLVILTLILFSIMIFIFYKLCLVVSKNKYSLSTIITSVFSYIYLITFLRTRPQLFEGIILLLELYLLEKYIDSKNNKYLYYLPILSLLMINIHASCFFMLFAFMLPYILNIRTKYTDNDKYNIKPLIIVTVVMFLTGFINPYGYKSIIYIFGSYGIDSINRLVSEMNPLDINHFEGKLMFILALFVFFTYILAKKKIKIRYIFLLLGTLYLSLSHIKGVQYFLLGSLFPISYILKDRFMSNDSKLHGSIKVNYYLVLITLLVIPVINIIRVSDYPNGDCEPVKILEYLNTKVNDKESTKIYTDYNTGGFFELNGYKPYLDPRAEVFLDSGILDEYSNVESGNIDYLEFVNKYDFDYIIISSGNLFSRHYLITDKNHKYVLVMTDITNEKNNIGYNLYEKVS